VIFLDKKAMVAAPDDKSFENEGGDIEPQDIPF
jgi:hypothetical protein